jgi:hypothetical protein
MVPAESQAWSPLVRCCGLSKVQASTPADAGVNSGMRYFSNCKQGKDALGLAASEASIILHRSSLLSTANSLGRSRKSHEYPLNLFQVQGMHTYLK